MTGKGRICRVVLGAAVFLVAVLAACAGRPITEKKVHMDDRLGIPGQH